MPTDAQITGITPKKTPTFSITPLIFTHTPVPHLRTSIPTTTETTLTDFTSTPESLPTKTAWPTSTPVPLPEGVEAISLKTSNCLSAGLPQIACTGVSNNHDWTPILQDFSGYDMMLVPTGCFMMGRDEGKAYEQPAHEICFDEPFWIDRFETTVSQFAQFMTIKKAPADDFNGWLNPWRAGTKELIINFQLAYQDGVWVPQPGDDARPVEAVTILGASEYCQWRESRLPSEAEWEYAARGPDRLLYPWGNVFNPDYVVRIYDKTSEVGSKPQGASWVGTLDMSSSLHEWTSTIFKPYPYDPNDGRETPLELDLTSERVLRGGSWYHPDGMTDNLTTTGRLSVNPAHAFWPFGFRCLRDFSP